jgi:integrase
MLNARKVAALSKPGLYTDDAGLCLQIQVGGSRSWIFRYKRAGKTRYMGLGSAKAITLARARELAQEPRRLHAEGRDPLAERQAQQAGSTRAIVTFAQAAEMYIASHERGWKSIKHRHEWHATLGAYVLPVIGAVPVDQIDTAAVLKVLRPIWTTIPESASRIRGRIEMVLDAAASTGLRTGENPARWKGHLKNLLPAPIKLRAVVPHCAMPYQDVPAFAAELRKRDSISAKALLFTILVAGRRSEVAGARWAEVDLEQRVWVVPAARMKAGKEHRVPLSDAALDILQPLHAVRSSEYVFNGTTGGSISGSAVNGLLRIMGCRVTAHGFRSSFRDWSAERTSYPSEVCEAALAHVVGNQTERAYKRADLFDRRRRLMADWASFCAQAPATAEVVPIRG